MGDGNEKNSENLEKVQEIVDNLLHKYMMGDTRLSRADRDNLNIALNILDEKLEGEASSDAV